ncbi:MAG TPA: helix-turn-helix transcriptional regulator [Mycobacterium sp.]|jgi:transcriptional regulator with XRE-family HTH domain|nr:helix-turn-helix transcriptional regulator [Mycobacterium sp.]
MSETIDTSRELAAFLRTRRERLAPHDVELSQGPRPRRTPGLRREEVAELAKVSVDYVMRLEQGRGLRPSPEVLDALAKALRLSIDERAYLFDLAQQRQVSGRQPPVQAPPESLSRLVRDLSPLPSMLVNHRFDILAWNPEMAALMLDFGALPDEQRNTMWLCMLHPSLSDFYRDREHVVRERIADLRAAWAAHPEDTALGELVEELTSHSTEFARLWAKRCVRVNSQGLTPLLHPRVGPLTVEYEVLTPLQDPDQRIIICRAADSASQAAMDAIAREVELPRLQAQ